MNALPNATARRDDGAAVNIDAMLRRELKIGDPRDPQQVAQALALRYQSQPRAQAIAGEARGLPFLHTPIPRGPETPPRVATDVDLEQARDDVRLDLEKLVADNLNKDIRPELEGWQTVLQRAIDEGVAAARFGLDPHKRDTAFAMRRQLGDYARLARLIGALTPALNRCFRNLAMSLDEVSSVLLVLMGESMANIGFAGGRFLLQTPYAELQARRDAVLNALRMLEGVGSTPSSSGWPRGLRAYRQLSLVLESRGQGDLRSLMNEAELARTMDELVQLASGNTPHGLRAIGATAWAPLNRMQRFVYGTLRQVAPSSSELATLHEALMLFLDGFAPAGGFRLLRISRPTVLNYGLYGSANISAAERRLMELVNRRGMLARELDCLTDCVHDRDTVLAQIVYDKLLYCIDRAIDYYSVGDADFGLPEARAAAFSHLIDACLPTHWPWSWRGPSGTDPATLIQPPGYIPPVASAPVRIAAIRAHLAAIAQLLRPTDGAGVTYLDTVWWDETAPGYRALLEENKAWDQQPTELRFPKLVRDELVVARRADREWYALVSQMTAGCIGADDALREGVPTAPRTGCLTLVLDRALDDVREKSKGKADGALLLEEPSVPMHIEEALHGIGTSVKKIADKF